ncbi:cytochrome P450 [Acrocarpospora catenulata]|uniref:cytochrome P450 n=1 Tax=Acrocarpospora catenulata TaxID=2836182 RepID=UPI001BDA9D94|nr:cytochrome P450 [Acrocarpospora catenulata]
MTASTLLLPGVSLGEMQPTAGAVWLPPSQWPRDADYLFRPRPVDTTAAPTVVSRYEDVLAVVLDSDGAWRREIPLDVVPREERHCILDASWLMDGETHRALRRSLRGINRGSTVEAREFTRTLMRQLLRLLMDEEPPWNLSRAIYEASLRVIVEHTLQAPPLLEHVARLRELQRLRVPPPRPDGSGSGLDYFGSVRQPEFEDIMECVPASYHKLPDGLARHLVSLHRSGNMTSSQLISQLGMLVLSHESQTATAASLIAMLLEHDLYGYAVKAAGQPELVRRMVAEGGRRGLSFPINLITPRADVTLGGRELPAGEPVLISYAAANMDPERFGLAPSGFDPRPQRPPHLAFGEGVHRCQGEVGAEQFVADVLLATLETLPSQVRLDHGGEVLREVTGMSWDVVCLPVSPA